MSDLTRHLESDEPEAPDALLRALRSAQTEPLFIPPTLDEAILREAHLRLTRRPRRGLNWFRFAPWLAAASVTIIAVSFIHLSHKPRFAREDLNRDGRIDIIDAFILAKQIKSGAPLKSTLDINGDGIVNGRDSETIAAQAVTLQKPDRS
jgi:hypothetical protein